MMDKHIGELTIEDARESGNILLIVAARLVRMEGLTPLHTLCELEQKVVSSRALRDAVGRVEDSIRRESIKIRDGYDRVAKERDALLAQLEAAQKELKKTQEEFDIHALRSEAAIIIGLLTAEGHQTFTLDKVADFFDDVFRKFEAAGFTVEGE